MRLSGLFDDLALCVGQQHRGRLLALYIMMLLSAVLEAFCAAIFVPFTSMLTDSGYLDDKVVFVDFFSMVNATTLPHRLLVYCIFMGIAFGVKNVYSVFFIYYKYSFIRRCHATLSQELLASYLHRDYAYHVGANSAELIRNVNHDVAVVYVDVLPSILTVFVDSVVVLVLLSLMLVSMPWQGIAIMALFVFMCVGFYKFTQKTSILLGAEQRRLSGEMFKWSIQGLASIKETKVMNKEDYFLEMFGARMRDYARIAARFSLIRESPRLFIEFVGVLVMLLITLILVYSSTGYLVVLPVLSLFAVSTFRMLPALNRLAAAFASIRFNRATLHGLYSDLEVSRSAPRVSHDERAIKMKEKIELREVDFFYPESERQVLHKLSLQIKRGESVALVGNSGAGKTTVVDLILGLLRPTGGEVLVDDCVLSEDASAWQRQVGYISQPSYLLDDTVRRNVAFGLLDDEIDDAQVWRALGQAQLTDVVRQLPGGLDSHLGEAGVRLSGGQRQRIGIARVLYRDPEILIFDEATSALDAVTEQEITRAIDELYGHKTIILIAHRLGTVRRCDRVYLLADGAVAASGSFEELRQTSEVFRRMIQLNDLQSSHEVEG